jgi:hypothetical protein
MREKEIREVRSPNVLRNVRFCPVCRARVSWPCLPDA